MKTLFRALRVEVFSLRIVAFALVAGTWGYAFSQSSGGCLTLESRLTSAMVTMLGGAPQDAGSLAELVSEGEHCLADEAGFSDYQRFSLAYALGYGNYLLGVLNSDTDKLNRAEQFFQQCQTLYNDEFDVPEKLAFSRLMPAWTDLRRYLIGHDPSYLERAFSYLTDPGVDFMTCNGDAKYLAVMVLLQRAEALFESNIFDQAAGIYQQVLQQLSTLAPGSSLQYLGNVARLHWARAVLMDPSHIQNGVAVDSAIAQTVANVATDGIPAEFTGVFPCLACLFQRSVELRTALKEAVDNYQAPATVPPCPDSVCTAEMHTLQAISAFFTQRAFDAGDDPEARFWSDWGRLLSYYRSVVPALGPGGGVLAGLFVEPIPTADWRLSRLEALRRYGALLVGVLSCHPGVGALPSGLQDDPRLHLNGLIDIAQGINTEEAGLLALALGKASNLGCLYQRAEAIFGVDPGGLNENQEVERLVRLACAHLKGGAFGPVAGISAIEAQLVGVPDGRLDLPHRVEKYFTLGVIHQFVYGWDGTAQQYFDQVDDVDPRSAYMLHYVAQPGAPDIPRLQRAYWQVQQLENQGYAVHWLSQRLAQILGANPAVAAPPPHLLPDAAKARWDILSPLYSENNIARQFYVNLVTALSEYATALAPIPSIPAPWVGQRPTAAFLQGPREFNLQSEIPARVSVATALQNPVNLWLIRNGQMVYSSSDYRGEEFHVTTGLTYSIVISSPGFWPSEIDTVFTSPHEQLAVHLSPALNVQSGLATGTKGANPLTQLNLWREGDAQLVYNPYQHTYFLEVGGGEAIPIVREMEGDVSHQITKFGVLPDRSYVFLDVLGGRLLLTGPGNSGDLSISEVIDLSGRFGIRGAVDLSVAGDKVFLVPSESKELLVWSRSAPAVDRVPVPISPTAVLALGAKPQHVWVADARTCNIQHCRGSEWNWERIPGLDSAITDGLKVPWRLLYLSDWGFIAVTDISTNRLYLFLPLGEYVGYIDLPPGHGLLYWVEINTGETGSSEMIIARGMGVDRFPLAPEGGSYNFALTGHYPESEGIENLWGGWLICR